MTNLQDIPTLAPYFFVDPDLTSAEAQTMAKSITPEDSGAHAGPLWMLFGS